MIARRLHLIAVALALTTIANVGHTAPALVEQELQAITERAQQASEKVQVDLSEPLLPANDSEKLLQQYEQMANDFQLGGEKKDIWVYRCQHVRGVTVRRVLENFVSSKGTVADSAESDMVVIQDVATNMPQLKAIVEELDRYVPQVLVEARVVELTVDSDYEKELQLAYESVGNQSSFVENIKSVLKTPGANPATDEGALLNFNTWETDEDQLTAFLRYLETRGRARILSKPNLVLVRGSEGSIVTGEEVPILTQTVTSGSVSTSTEFKSVGIKLQVTPLMIADDMVRVRINPEVSTVTGFSSAGDGVSNPIIAVRQARTELKVKDNELISIGGLLRNEEREVHRRVPGLASVPLLGHLFTSTRKEKIQTQLVIFLNIQVLEEGQAGGTRIVRPSAIHPEVQKEMDEMERIETSP